LALLVGGHADLGMERCTVPVGEVGPGDIYDQRLLRVPEVVRRERLVQAGRGRAERQMEEPQDRGLAHIVRADDDSVPPQFEVEVFNSTVVPDRHTRYTHLCLTPLPWSQKGQPNGSSSGASEAPRTRIGLHVKSCLAQTSQRER